MALLASLLCILIGLVIGFLCLVILSWVNAAKGGDAVDFGAVLSNAWSSGFKPILMGGFFMRPIGIGREIASAAPLIMTGLSVGFAFKTGLFNIGAAGQYTVGAFGAIFAASMLHLPWWACLICSALFGAVWGAIPGLFKAYLNINEVITAIMFNWIGLYAVNTIMYGGGSSPMYDVKTTKTWSLRNTFPDAVIPDFGLGTFFKNRSTTIAIFLAILVAVIVYIVVDKTTFGYELKACGINKDAAKYAGINEKRNIVLSMVIAGALAGFGAGLYYLSGVAEWSPMNSTALPGIGFDGISVALLASSNPIGIIFSALFISHISTGGGFMNASVFPPEVADVISGVIIYLCAFALLFRGALGRVFKSKDDTNVNAEPAPAAAEPKKEGEA
ncbi:ABC transporter permease [Pseudoflavonifractor sp. MSJ-37]|nr:ABC transporter permease [Pseudoflavonifractor sp. MSJ-37]MBU5434433.1 ABC transporter permease [Pseudoflavonifractor sp. MSJ-37]